ncbi:hypothetical protein HM1_0195 [Heliomicrobium modesticaldum Ice1]|uniref:Uncharacterized protein n=1 Tax=Heliobacterium modesticaldum (strain ATCC 51547 / Ice1) TaxID=498761 RepID=B0TDV1_HELMI|nr:hypothetical protein HM1_0195 [Heliomicrobium modesticaldum Ice1]
MESATLSPKGEAFFFETAGNFAREKNRIIRAIEIAITIYRAGRKKVASSPLA